MTSFIGDYTCKVDAKGRVVLPSALKRQIDPVAEGKFVVKKEIFEKCLVLYPMDEWKRQIELIRKKINPYNREHNRFLRELFKGMAEVELDNMNRLLIPKRLLESVSIEKDVVLLGQDGKIEIWSDKLYGNIGGGEDDFSALAEKIMGGPINDDDK